MSIIGDLPTYQWMTYRKMGKICPRRFSEYEFNVTTLIWKEMLHFFNVYMSLSANLMRLYGQKSKILLKGRS